MNHLPKIFKNTSRYSDATRPAIGESCFFSHAITLLKDELVPKTKHFLHEWIKQDSIVKIKRNLDHTVEVRFTNSDQTDLVSPEFLIRRELTAFGQAFFDQNKKLMAPQVRKLFIGETK